MAMTTRCSCERFPIYLFGRQAQLNVPDLSAYVGPLECGIHTIRPRLLQGKRDQGTLFVSACLERPDQSRNSLGVRMRRDATPHFTAHRPSGCPSLLGKIDEHASQSWITPPV